MRRETKSFITKFNSKKSTAKKSSFYAKIRKESTIDQTNRPNKTRTGLPFGPPHLSVSKAGWGKAANT